MEASIKNAARLASSICLLALLAGCSGGGGGGTSLATTTPSTPAASTPAPPASTTPTPPATPTINANVIGPPGTASNGGLPANLANGTTNNFLSNSLQSIGTVFSLKESVLQITPNKISDANVSPATATFQGSLSGSHAPVFDLKVPSIGLDVHGVMGDATTQTLVNGGSMIGSFFQLNYTVTGQWSYIASATSMSGQFGTFTTGYQTPNGNVPNTGSANYIGSSGAGTPQGGFASGLIFTPDGSGGIAVGSVIGAANLSVNFGSGGVTGSLTGMQSKVSAGATALPWNTVNLAGNLSGATVSGTSSTSGPPSGAGALGFSSAATGTFSGALYGPAVDEVGAVWSLAEPTVDGGRAVQGTFMATHQ